MDNITKISHELNNPKASGYLDRRRRENELLNGVLSAAEPDQGSVLDSILEASSDDSLAPVDLMDKARPRHVQPAVEGSADDSSDSVIRIKNMKVAVTVTCKFSGSSGRQKKFSVGLDAISVDADDNGVSLILDNKTSIDPPVTEPLELTCNGVTYNVVYTGGRHRLGPFINMYFTLIEQ